MSSAPAQRDVLLEEIAELKRSNDDLKYFACIAAHDLQEPLRMVTRFVELLARRYKGRLDADADEFIAFAMDGASRMQRLIQGLLEFSSAATKDMKVSETSGERALEQALLNLSCAIEESGATITYDPLPTVLADPQQLVQLFQNLVGNAVKYRGSRAPQVHISADRTGGENWRFSVEDNGLGIDPREFEKIFGAFQRLHTEGEYSGNGLGLAICEKIAGRHGSSISVESQPGKGSTFRFALKGGRTKA